MDNGFDLTEFITEKKDEAIIVWLCNIGAEKYWNDLSPGIIDNRENEIAMKMEEINLLLCRSQDILILRENPAPDFLNILSGYGFSSPLILCPRNCDPNLSITELVLKDEDLLHELMKITQLKGQTYFVPYAVTELEEKLAEMCNLSLIGPSSTVCKCINNKVYNREIAQKLNFPVCEGQVCRSMDEIREAFATLSINGCFKRIVIKEPYGASGKGMYVVDRPELLEPTIAVISRFARKTGNSNWLVEGWYEKKMDINYQIYISRSGKINLISIKEQILNGVIYVGSRMGSTALSAGIVQAYSKIAERLGNYLYGLGYTGIASIDSIITGTGIIIPIIEINGRLSLSTYVSYINRFFSESIVMSMYYRVKASKTVSYIEVYNALEKEGLSYNIQKKEGIIIYSSATLPKCPDNSSELCPGRLFVLFISPESDGVEQLKSGFETVIKSIFDIIA